jgi:HAD superfamily hydrolase (TIGR01509 family)
LQYEAILFDFDGVLVDSEPVHWQCWNEILASFGAFLDWDRYCSECIGVSDRDMIARLCAQFDPPLAFDDVWAQYPHKKELFRGRMAKAGAIGDDVITLVRELRAKHLLAVVTSSGRREVEPVLELSGILPHLTTAVYGSDVQRLKPAPDPYLLAVQRLGVQKALVVEDSAAGLAAGRAAGLDVLHIPSQECMCGVVREALGLQLKP